MNFVGREIDRDRASGYLLMEKRILFLLLVMMVFLNLTRSTRVPFCATRSVKDSIFGFRDQTCPVSGVESDERPHFGAVTEVN